MRIVRKIPNGTQVAAHVWMHAQASKVSPAVRDHFLADHRRLEDLFDRLLAAFEANDREDMARLWTEFESGLMGHMQTEELELIPALLRDSPRSARIIMEEHRHIRARLAELGMSLDLHTLRLDTARAFVDELRAHARSEDRLLYQWAEESLDDAEKESIIRLLADRVRAYRLRGGKT
jgi:hemerythrin-like domain-containing protein